MHRMSDCLRNMENVMLHVMRGDIDAMRGFLDSYARKQDCQSYQRYSRIDHVASISSAAMSAPTA